MADRRTPLNILSSTQRRGLRLAWRFIRPYRWQSLGALLALVITAGITLSMGQGIRLLVDQGFMTRSPHLLNQSIGVFMVLVVALAAGTFTRFYLVSWIGERCVADIRRAVFDHLIQLHPGFYENNRASEIQSRLTTDTTLLQSVIGSSLSLFLRNALMVIGGIVLLFVTNPKLTGIVVLALPLVLAPILVFGRRVRGLSRQSQDRIADVGSYVAETLGQIKTVQAYNHQGEDRRRFALAVEQAFTTARLRIVQRAWLITLVIVLVLGAVGVMLWVGGMDVIAGRISGANWRHSCSTAWWWAAPLAPSVRSSVSCNAQRAPLNVSPSCCRRAVKSSRPLRPCKHCRLGRPGACNCRACRSPIRRDLRRGPSITSA